MDAEELISEATLARLWRVDPKTLIKWRNRGRIDSDVKERSNRGFHHYYLLTSIDAYHCVHSSGFGPDVQIPAAEQLLESSPALLKPEEAAALYGCSVGVMWHHIREGSAPAFHLGNKNSTRMPATLTAVLASSADGYVSIETAARLLCVAPSYVRRLMKDGLLSSELFIGGGRTEQVERQSLLALLGTLITPSVTPEQWWEKTLQTSGPPLSKEQMRITHHVHDRTLTRLIAENSRSLPYIRTMGALPQTLIPAWGVQTFLREERERLLPEELSALFGVGVEQTSGWRPPRGQFCTKRHGQAGFRCPTRRCVREYIVAHRTHPSIDPEEWMTVTLQRGLAAVSDEELMATTPMLEPPDIGHAVASGTLRGVRLPAWQGKRGAAFPLTEARSFRRVWDRQLSVAGY